MLSQLVLIRDGVQYVDDPNSYAVMVALIGLAGRLAQLLCFGVLVHLSTRLYMNHKETAGSILSASGRRLLPFVGLTLLLGLFGLAALFVASLASFPFGPLRGFVIMIILILWLVYYSLAPPVFWYEGIPASKSMRRSRDLVSGRFWRVFGSLAVGLVIIGVFSVGLGALVVSTLFNVESPAPYVVLALGLEFIGTVISFAILAPIVTVVYFDGRVRREGFDLQLQLDDTDSDKPPEPPPTVPW
jgi:hypothetical protein